MTLGVMALEPDAEEAASTGVSLSPSGLQAQEPGDPLKSGTLSLSLSETSPSSRDAAVNTSTIPTYDSSSTLTTLFPAPRKTVSTALALLRSLQPAISNILRGEMGVKVPLTALDVMKTIPMRPPTSTSVPANVADAGSNTQTSAEGESLGAGLVDPARLIQELN